MAEQIPVPYVAPDYVEVTDLIRKMTSGTEKTSRAGGKTFSCKKTNFEVEGSPAHLRVDSWRFQEWDYKRRDLPTYARGLFTGKNEKGQSEIAIRGYDKFFNVGEVENTRWEKIEQFTKGPYELSLKENGCIIFISGLHDGSLLVCSKHSTGPRGDIDLSHAKAGEKWVDRQLKALGKTRQDLARELRKRNVTAVAELCDDDFEEHILAYTKDAAGLYLHGININVPTFTTYSGAQVQNFANEWGFKQTDFLVIDDVASTRQFLQSVAESGSYNGRDIEGFVVRCKARFGREESDYDWFFKYKFEEPYLMYRQWRECTKALILGKQPMYRKHIKVTEDYLLYARTRLAKDPKLGKEYNKNHGIIGLRNDFLKEIGMKGSDIIREEYGDAQRPEEVSKNVILVPISTIGCGKTTIAVALEHLFGWGHVQNDNITGKARPPKFTGEVLTQLETKPVVFADRNNAQKHERKQIIDDIYRLHGSAHLVALNFLHATSMDRIRQVTQDRVFSRGDNHQTIQAASEKSKVIGIMEGFMHRFEPLNPESHPDSGFEAIIDLDGTLDSRQNLETVISRMYEIFPSLFTEMPTSEDLDTAITVALHEYKPNIKHDLSARGPQTRGPQQLKGNKQPQKPNNPPLPKKKPLEYISVFVPHNQILDILENVFSKQSKRKAMFFHQLQNTHRVQHEFHVTLIHRASAKAHPELWDRYSKLHADSGAGESTIGSCQLQLERVIWDDRLMTIVVRIIDGNWDSSNSVPHITVGTRGEDVKPKESNDLLRRWLEVGSGDESGIGEAVLAGVDSIEGTVHGVLSR